ncbi:MAG: PASTA domain-containing protein [Ruminococcus sp.]|nr:PASTA domain-containing protein [Ruminococcus sp.]
MVFDKHLCMGCMNELDENGVCHYCNYTDNVPFLQSYLAPKTVLDNRYIVGKMLSYNGEGASYICYDTVAKAKVVIREYMPDTLCEREKGSQRIIADSDCLAKYKTFMSEFVDMNKVLSRMRNLDHIVTAEDIIYANNTTYVVLDYVEGVSLKKFLQSNKGFLTWEQVKKLLMPLFTTLSIIHNAGIIHRGISPENIIVTTDGELKLTGFSISSIRTANTGLSTEFYSGYTAPEQYSCLDWQGTWTDVYAIAAVTYRILTGIVPLDANTRITNDTMPEAIRVNPRVPAHVSKVLARAMCVKGSDRIQTITKLVSALFEPRNHMEHQKGATQTIPVQKPSVRNNIEKPVNDTKMKQMNIAAVVTGVIILTLIIGLGVFLIYQILTPGREDNSSVSDISSSVSESSMDDSSKTIQTTSAKPESKYGYGSIMPNVVDMRYETALKQLSEDFAIRVDYFYSDEIQKGIITEQSIAAGSDYDPKLKNELILKVSKGSELVPVPSYSGLTKKQYLDILDSLEIAYTTENGQSSTVSAGYVDSTNPAPGENVNVKEGEVVTVTISVGMPQTSAKEPESSLNESDQSSDSENQSTLNGLTESQVIVE